MWTTFRVSRFICLSTLVVVMLISAFEAGPTIQLSCCSKPKGIKEPENITGCFEQKERHGCKHHAFVVITPNQTHCVTPTPPWLKKLMNEGTLKCPLDLSKKLKYKFVQ